MGKKLQPPDGSEYTARLSPLLRYAMQRKYPQLYYVIVTSPTPQYTAIKITAITSYKFQLYKRITLIKIT